jgi:hypothetical protein
MDFSHYLFRCSALGHLMTSEKGKDNYQNWMDAADKVKKLNEDLAKIKQFDAKGNIMKSYQNKVDAIAKANDLLTEAAKYKDVIVLSEGTKTHLMDIWISETKRRKADINNKFIEKGLAMEEDGITLYSRVKKVFFKKNETHLVNLFIKGTPDSFIGKSIHEADRIPDIKCSWSANTFYRTFTKKLNELYYWQGVGYMWLTGAKYFDLAYCLVNTPASLIEAEKRNLWYKLGQPTDDNENWQIAQQAIERNMLFDDIPLNERVLEYTIERQESDIELLKKKITAAREYLNWLDNEFALKFAA